MFWTGGRHRSLSPSYAVDAGAAGYGGSGASPHRFRNLCGCDGPGIYTTVVSVGEEPNELDALIG